MPESREFTNKTVGLRLSEARQEHGLSIQEVANRLYLETRIIEALEADAYDRIPAAIFVQGYIRAYAKLLELAPDPLVKLYQQQIHPEQPILHIPGTKGHVQGGSSRDFWYKALTLVIVLALIVLVALWRLATTGPKPAAEAPASAENEEALDLDKAAVLPPPLNLQREDGGGVSLPAAGEFTPPAEGGEIDVPLPAPTQPARAEAPPPAEAQTVAPPAPALDPRVVKLEFRADSWTEITDSQKQKLFARTAKNGEKVELNGTPPFKMVIGRPADVTLEYRGKPVDLGQYRGRVARFELGAQAAAGPE